MFGYPPGAQIGQPTRIWYEDDAQDAEIGAEAYGPIWRGETYIRELPVRRRDGTPFWVRFAARAIDVANPARGTVLIIEDISGERAAAAELHRAHEEQRAIVESATSGIVLIRDRVLQRANRKLHEIFGWEPGTMVGQTTRIWYADEAGWIAGGGKVYEEIWRGETHHREQQLDAQERQPVLGAPDGACRRSG